MCMLNETFIKRLTEKPHPTHAKCVTQVTVQVSTGTQPLGNQLTHFIAKIQGLEKCVLLPLLQMNEYRQQSI